MLSLEFSSSVPAFYGEEFVTWLHGCQTHAKMQPFPLLNLAWIPPLVIGH